MQSRNKSTCSRIRHCALVSQRPLKFRSFRTPKNNYMSVCELVQKYFSCKIRNSDVDYSHEASTGLRPWYPSFLRRNPPKHPPLLSKLRPAPTVVGYGRQRSEGPPFAFVHGLIAVVFCAGGQILVAWTGAFRSVTIP